MRGAVAQASGEDARLPAPGERAGDAVLGGVVGEVDWGRRLRQRRCHGVDKGRGLKQPRPVGVEP